MLSTSDMQARKPVKFTVSALTMAMMLATLSVSPAQADDLEIYQPAPTGDGNTIMMMLDGSAQMHKSVQLSGGGGKDSGMNLLVSGMQKLLINPDPVIAKTAIGAGRFGDKKGTIDVPAKPLGDVTTPLSGQRKLLMDAIKSYDANVTAGSAPMQGFAEAAAYMLGTKTVNSGFADSVSTSKKTDLLTYESPIKKSTCGGNGIYFLTTGAFSDKGDTGEMFDNALNLATGSFNCPVNYKWGTPATDKLQENGSPPWNCIAGLAKRLYDDKDSKPKKVSIKSAFIAFGKEYDPIASGKSSEKNICHIGSRLVGDPCSPQNPTDPVNPNANPSGGYGNGYFKALSGAKDFADSVIFFAKSLGGDTVSPLVTGAPTIPIDDLNPNGFQDVAYLRMLEPNPTVIANMLWKGDVKKYGLGGGAMVSAVGTDFILTADGYLNKGTTDNWNKTGTPDGTIIDKGGAYPKVPMPTTTTPDTLRPLFTDVGDVDSDPGEYDADKGTTPDITINSISSVDKGTSLTRVAPLKLSDGKQAANLPTSIPLLFNASDTTVGPVDSPLKKLSIVMKKKLINYLGFAVPIYVSGDNPRTVDTTETFTFVDESGATVTHFKTVPEPVPKDLGAPPANAFLAMGGSVHAQPIQFSYESDVDADGKIENRIESVLYGSMEGALHLVNADTGVEQMAFVPAEILADDIGSRALRVGEQNTRVTQLDSYLTPSQGVDGPWVVDSAYKATKGSTKTTLNATRMNVYGGLRMGGSSYYGLNLKNLVGDVLDPKLLFKLDKNVTGFERIGQSWSKPVLANVRVGNVITRVMIVGGGYDIKYENPAYVPTAADPARGNTVYMVNATTGDLIWSAPAGTTIHSIPARVSAIDRDGDTMIDNIYFADLGGQVFRADFNNTFLATADASKFPVRVTQIADLATDAQKTVGTNPRFYEAPTVTIHKQGTTIFGLVTVASGNRSSPLDVLDVAKGGKNLRSLPVNNVYGLIDRDVARVDLIKLNAAKTAYVEADGTSFDPLTEDKRLDDLQINPQVELSGVIGDAFFPASTGLDGWYRSLSSTSKCSGSTCTSDELANGTFRYPGGFKAYEEQIALTGKLYVPVYDPQGEGVEGTGCQAHVVGETDRQEYCLPYGVCLKKGGPNVGEMDDGAENQSGAQFTNGTADDSKNSPDRVIGPGIRGISLGNLGTIGACKSFTMVGNVSGHGEWTCNRKLVQTLWYEKQPNSSKVK